MPDLYRNSAAVAFARRSGSELPAGTIATVELVHSTPNAADCRPVVERVEGGWVSGPHFYRLEEVRDVLAVHTGTGESACGPGCRYAAAWRSARRRAEEASEVIGRYETCVTEMARDLEEALGAEPYPALAWLVPTSELQPELSAWRRPVWWGSDIQSGRGWRTLAVRIPGRAYLLLRLWPMRGEVL